MSSLLGKLEIEFCEGPVIHFSLRTKYQDHYVVFYDDDFDQLERFNGRYVKFSSEQNGSWFKQSLETIGNQKKQLYEIQLMDFQAKKIRDSYDFF
jgi:hypothetical protein